MRLSVSTFLLALTFVVGVCYEPASIEAGQPNIIFIMADDLGYNELGCYGQKWIKTPNIDRIAAEGMKFTQFLFGAGRLCSCSLCIAHRETYRTFLYS